MVFLIIFAAISLPASADDQQQQQLRVCARYQACAAEVGHFPLLSETVGEMIDVADEMDAANGAGSGHDASGWGAGGGGRLAELPVEDFPLYDEFVTSPPLFDYQTEAELTRTDICRCPQQDGASDDDATACEFDRTDGANVMRVDKSIRLAFCQPLADLFKLKCGGRRGLLRIIGEVDAKTGESLASVNDTAVFCRCEPPAQLRRLAVEPWLDKYAFVYQCTAP